MHWIDHNYLPKIKGKIERFLLNPRGEADGLVFTNNQVVHFPPHLSKKVTRAVKIDDTVIVRGVRPRNSNLIAAVAITPNNGKDIIDEGPDHGFAPKDPIASRIQTVEGKVLLSLYGPKGELRGALLSNGISIRIPKDQATDFQEYLTPGAEVWVSGRSVKNKHGATIDVEEIAFLESI